MRRGLLLTGVVALLGLGACAHAQRVNEAEAEAEAQGKTPIAPTSPTLGQAPIQTVPEDGLPGPAAPMPVEPPLQETPGPEPVVPPEDEPEE